MKIICLGLTIWFWFSFVHIATTLAKVEYLYYQKGETVVLQCMQGAFSVTWNGPAHMTLNPTKAREPDIYGKSRNWNLSVYFNRFEFNPKLPHLNRLEIVGNNDAGVFDLQIENVSLFDEGLYECDVEPEDKNETIAKSLYLLQIKALPTEMVLVNSTWDDTITGIENESLVIECRVKSGKPQENLTLKINEITVNTGGHGSIAYDFIPDRTNHNNQLLCEAESPSTPVPLSKTVKINIKYKPILSTTNEEIEVNEGTTIYLCSSVDSNPAPDEIWWSKDHTKLLNKNITSHCYEIPNITRKDKGFYTCTAKNEIGEGSISTTVLVRYPPVVKIKYANVTMDTKQRSMQCIAEGIPVENSFSQWVHRSEYNEHIRYLNSSRKGYLILPSIELKLNRYQDSGIYTCRVSNGIPGRKGNYEQKRNVYFVSKGPPVFVYENSPTQYGYIGQTAILKWKVLSYSKIICTEMRKVNGITDPKDTLKIATISSKLIDVFHGKNVSVNGFEVVYTLSKLREDHFQMYNLTVCNMFGSQSYIIELVLSNINGTTRKENNEKWTVPIGFSCFVLFFAVILLIVYTVKIKKRTNNSTFDDHQDNVEGLADPVENIMYHSVQGNQNNMMPSPVSTLLPDNTSSNGTDSETGTMTYSKGTIGQSMESRLNYADVVFQPSASQDTVRIIGLEDRTVYADVDTSRVAICHPENRSDTSSSDDDFVYIDGIENYIQKRETND